LQSWKGFTEGHVCVLVFMTKFRLILLVGSRLLSGFGESLWCLTRQETSITPMRWYLQLICLKN